MFNENKKPDPPLEVLEAFYERVRVAILGEEDPEYRSELEFLEKRTKAKIREVAFKQGKLIE